MAESQISLDVQKDTFSRDDVIKLTGRLEGGNANQPLAIEVKDPDNNTILIRTVQTDANGNFALKFKFPSSAKAGVYSIVANAEADGIVTKVKQITLSDQLSVSQPSKGGCLIATAAFGSELAPQVQMLRETRNNILMKTQSGAAFMTAFNQFYYTFSPTVADWERQNALFKEAVKITITPLLTTLSILNFVGVDSEDEMILYGVSIILLNIGMYFVAPAFVIVKLKHR